MYIRNNTMATFDTMLSLQKEFCDDTSNDCIILCGQEETKTIDELKTIYDKVIVYNLEHPNTRFFNEKYINLLQSCDEVWDDDEYSIEQLSYIRNDIKLHLLKPFITIPEQEKTYDVLFYGLWNDRRAKILYELRDKGVNILALNNIWGDDLNEYIAKSKCLLNIHFYEDCIQEQARMVRWVGNGKIFSEKSRKNYLNVDEYEYDELVPKIIEYIN